MQPLPKRKTHLTTIILIIDDSQGVRRILTFVLQTRGYKVLTAEDGHQAKQILSGNTTIDLIILDIHMPGIGGFELLQHLRIQPPWKHTPVLMLSAEATEAEHSQALALGANAYMAKPFKPSDLLNNVEQLLI